MKYQYESIKNIDLGAHIHASNYYRKIKRIESMNGLERQALSEMFHEYYCFHSENASIVGYSMSAISKRVDSLNKYYEFLNINNYRNIFSAQSKFRPTIIEEFMYYLFRDFINETRDRIHDTAGSLMMGGVKAYANLYFAENNLRAFVAKPKIGVNNKEQDFAIYRPVTLKIDESSVINVNLPIVAIENKTFIDKTMLEGSIATADKLKSGNPHSKYYIVTETYEVDLNVDPAFSRIDQIYVLRKCRRRNENMKIHAEVVYDLFVNVKEHLSRDWCNVEDNISCHGRII